MLAAMSDPSFTLSASYLKPVPQMIPLRVLYSARFRQVVTARFPRPEYHIDLASYADTSQHVAV
ncbi:hypothetical protein CLV47_10153 [Antricoccus suffuscus]|uniref:Uncharacterized protein n=1 Tax=Antricoccus suffuscus TaxID=1629062 RepID=A0A2T1A5R2_9ACTN|nr:hypothetical protein CLV47_10153 [Antricoccus suffuscus]